MDFGKREGPLEGLGDAPHLLVNWRDGRVKMWVTQRALEFRQRHIRVFEEGEYVPLEIAGGDGEPDAMAFARVIDGEWSLTVVPRLLALHGRAVSALRAPALPGEAVVLPVGAPRAWRNALTGENMEAAGGRLHVDALWRECPVGLLHGQLPVERR